MCSITTQTDSSDFVIIHAKGSDQFQHSAEAPDDMDEDDRRVVGGIVPRICDFRLAL